MPERSRKRPRDLNQLAQRLVQEATGEALPEPASPAKGPRCGGVRPTRASKPQGGRRAHGGLDRRRSGSGKEAVDLASHEHVRL